ncbi:MAG: LamG domain-containing protein, partial [Thermoplasmata archaeon]
MVPINEGKVLVVALLITCGLFANMCSVAEKMGKLEIGEKDTELVAKWTFNENSGTTAYDISGNGHHATIHGAQWTVGINGSGLSFGGSSYLVTTSQITLFSPLTMVLWLKYNISMGVNTVISNRLPGYQSYGTALFVNSWPTEDRSVHLEVGDGTTGGGVVTPTNTIIPGKFIHLVAVWNGSQSKIYVNGIESASGNLISISKTDYLYIGRMAPGGDAQYFNGIIDEVSIYSRAFSAEEVVADYMSY